MLLMMPYCSHMKALLMENALKMNSMSHRRLYSLREQLSGVRGRRLRGVAAVSQRQPARGPTIASIVPNVIRPLVREFIPRKHDPPTEASEQAVETSLSPNQTDAILEGIPRMKT
ncbi:hypothetical protein EYF80_036831 [Liparis tanakae]|uniref:Uncharacterized protein n=1 Tax=Liparis tanakae TaxID=230148 RepID=A0A4Z2GHP1_9TELE|nr:hypothetical protein EYF80_036831 [Liparis tanakae]